MSRLREKYQSEIVDAMVKKFGYKNIMEVPKLDKIVVNMGIGEAKENAKVLEAAIKDMETIYSFFQKDKSKAISAVTYITERIQKNCSDTSTSNGILYPTILSLSPSALKKKSLRCYN